MIRNRQVEINQAIKRNVEVPEDIKLKVFKKLFIGGLALETAREDLIEHFSGFGKVANAYVIYDPISKQSKSKKKCLILDFGYVEFENIDDATRAANCKEHIVTGKKISVQFFKTKGSQKANFSQGTEKGSPKILEKNTTSFQNNSKGQQNPQVDGSFPVLGKYLYKASESRPITINANLSSEQNESLSTGYTIFI